MLFRSNQKMQYPRQCLLLSPNEDSDFFHNQLNITKRKKHIGKRNFVFLINNLLDYLRRVVICVNIVFWTTENLQKNTFQKINFFSKTQQLFA